MKRLALLLAMVPGIAWGQALQNNPTFYTTHPIGTIPAQYSTCGGCCMLPGGCPPPPDIREIFQDKRIVNFSCPDGYMRILVEGERWKTLGILPKCVRPDAIIEGEWK